MAIKLPFLKRLRYLFSTTSAISGALFLLLAAFIFSFQLEDIDVKAAQIPSDAPTTKGWVTDSWYWGFGLDETDYYGIDYEYLDPNTKQSYYWTSYATHEKKIGDEVIIEYAPEHPSVSRIKGLSNTLFSPPHTVGVIFLIILGLIVLTSDFSNYWAKLYLLKHGTVTKGKLQKVRRTSDGSRNSPILRFQFVFQTKRGKKVQILVKSERKEALSDEDEELLVYLENKPKNAVLVDDFPSFIVQDIREQAEKLYATTS